MKILEYNTWLSLMDEHMQKHKMDRVEIAFHIAVPVVIISLVGVLAYNMVELVQSIFVAM